MHIYICTCYIYVHMLYICAYVIYMCIYYIYVHMLYIRAYIIYMCINKLYVHILYMHMLYMYITLTYENISPEDFLLRLHNLLRLIYYTIYADLFTLIYICIYVYMYICIYVYNTNVWEHLFRRLLTKTLQFTKTYLLYNLRRLISSNIYVYMYIYC